MNAVKFLQTSTIVGAIVLFSGEACDSDGNVTPDTNNSSVDCSTNPATFAAANVIIQSSCSRSSSCHGNGSQSGPGALTSYDKNLQRADFNQIGSKKWRHAT